MENVFWVIRGPNRTKIAICGLAEETEKKKKRWEK